MKDTDIETVMNLLETRRDLRTAVIHNKRQLPIMIGQWERVLENELKPSMTYFDPLANFYDKYKVDDVLKLLGPTQFLELAELFPKLVHERLFEVETKLTEYGVELTPKTKGEY